MTEREQILKVTFESDWHIGSGAGIPGSIDRQVLRDDNGLPYVPGKTLTGILRDAAEWVATTRDRIENGNKWAGALHSLFGSQKNEEKITPSEAILGISNANFSQEVTDALRTNDDIRNALFVVRPGIKIDPNTGCTLKDHLFSTEEVRGGCVLYARIRLSQELDLNQKKLFGDAVKAVRRIGGKRRRGGGRCRLELLSDKKSETSTHNSVELLPGVGEDQVTEGHVIMDFRLTTLQPVIVNKVTLGNVVKSDATLPGVVLLPYLTRNILGLDDDPAWQLRMQGAVMNGEFSVGCFLPEFDGHIASPVPLSFAQPKGEARIINRIVTPADDKKQWKDLRSGYVFAMEGQKLFYAKVEDLFVLRTHNTIDDKRQRPTEDAGGLFTYQAIREGLVFRGTVRVSASFWKEICQKLPPEKLKRLENGITSIGQSRKDEYGRIRLEYVGSSKPQTLPELVNGKYLLVYMASDILFRDNRQSYTADPEVLREGLAAALGLELKNLDWGAAPVSPLGGDRGHCLRTGRRESWHTRWSLPRPSLVYLQAGSVCAFEVMNPECWDQQKAQKIETEGLGGRRAEGYGRLQFNPSFLACDDFEIHEYRKKLDEVQVHITLQAPSEDSFLRLLQDEACKRRFTHAVRRTIYRNIKELLEQDRPATSQFGALREAAASISDGEGGWKVFDAWLGAKFDESKKINEKNKKKNWNEGWLSFLLNASSTIGGLSLIEKYKTGPITGNFEKVLGLAKSDLGPGFPDRLRAFALRTFFDVFCEAVFDNDKKSSSLEGR